MNGYPWLVQFARSLLSGPETMPPALLLAGQKGLGKVDLARAIAGAVLCESRERGVHACGECSACVWFRAGNHPDFRLLEPEPEADAEESRGEVEEQSERKEKKASTQITIQQIRDLAQFVNLTSHRDGYRVVLLHPAETMNANAANALLKTLEEPPARTLFVLVTHHPGRLLPTLLSRCRIVKIGVPDRAVALKWLNERGVADAEMALALAGQAPLQAAAMSHGDYHRRRKAWLGSLLEAGRPGNSSDAAGLSEQALESGLIEIMLWLQTWCHDLIELRLAGNNRYHLDFARGQRELAQRADIHRLLQFEHSLAQARKSIDHPLNRKLLLERLMLEYLAVY